MPTSSAETITSSALELVNGSGSIIWTSQNFPALRSGDTIELNVINNTLPTYMDAPDRSHIGFFYTLNDYSMNELFTEVFPSGYYFGADVENYYNRIVYVDYLSNKYYHVTLASQPQGFNQVLINKDIFRLYLGDVLKIDDKKYSVLDFDGAGDNKALVCCSRIVGEGQVAILDGETWGPTIIVYIKKMNTDNLEIQGIIQVKSGIGYSIVNNYGKLKLDGTTMKNYDNIPLSEGITDITDELKLVRTSNKVYASANIIKKDMNIQFIPKPIPTPTPTPIPTTPIQTPTLSPTATNTPTPIVTPSITHTITPTSTPTVTATLKERLNKTEERQSQQESRKSWLESAINSILDWLKSIF